jgi:gliding motility-associated-like protein
MFIFFFLGGLILSFFSFKLLAQSVTITVPSDFTWKAISSTPNGGFISDGASNAWMLTGYNDSAWSNASAASWSIPPINDIPGIQHIWYTPYNDSILLRKEFVMPVADSYSGSIISQVDNWYNIYFNGMLLGNATYLPSPPANYNITASLAGCQTNTVAVEARNFGGSWGAKFNISITANNPLNTPIANQETNVSCSSFIANWDSVPTADFYLLDVSTDPLFGSFYLTYNDFNVGSSLSYTLNSLPPGVNYYYRLRCQRTNGLGTLTSCYSEVIEVSLDSPTFSYTAPDTICAGYPIVLQLNAPGASVGWVGPNGFISADSISNITSTSSINSGNYIYTINYPGCLAVSDTIYIEVVDVPDLIITPSGPYCSSGEADTLICNASLAHWFGAGVTDMNTGTFSPSVAGGGSHTITCTLDGYCPDTAIAVITVNINGGYTLSGSDTICEGDNILLNSSSGPGAIIQWSGPNGFSSTLNNNIISNATTIHTGVYMFSISYPSCPTVFDTLEVHVFNYPNPYILPAGPFCNHQLPVILMANPNGGIWSGEGIIDNSIGSFDPGVAGVGQHTIYYNFPGNCPGSDTLLIDVMNNISLGSVVFPNVFTPDGDGINDVFSLQLPMGGHYQLVIYNRWGVEIFNGGTDIGWSGIIGTAMASEGTYYWICNITSDCATESLIEKGFLQLFKLQ